MLERKWKPNLSYCLHFKGKCKEILNWTIPIQSESESEKQGKKSTWGGKIIKGEAQITMIQVNAG